MTESGAADRRVGPPSSVLCHLIFDIVKRVVTVKLGTAVVPGDGGSWLDLGMGMRRDAGARGLGGAKAYASASAGSDQKAAGSILGCVLPSALCQARLAARLGLSVGEFERRASGECLGTERR
jgi:hypothetical protein